MGIPDISNIYNIKERVNNAISNPNMVNIINSTDTPDDIMNKIIALLKDKPFVTKLSLYSTNTIVLSTDDDFENVKYNVDKLLRDNNLFQAVLKHKIYISIRINLSTWQAKILSILKTQHDKTPFIYGAYFNTGSFKIVLDKNVNNAADILKKTLKDNNLEGIYWF